MPKVLGWEHLLYLGFFIVVFVSTLFLIKKKVKDEKTLTIIVKSVGVLLFCAVMFNRICLVIYDDALVKIIPDTFCGMSSLAFSLAIIFGKKDNFLLHSVAYIGMLGGILTIAYPDFIGQDASIFYLPTISGLFHHTVMIYLFLLIILTGYLKPTYKKWYAMLIGGAGYIVIGYILYFVFDNKGAMCIGKPLLEGTILYWYVIGPIFLVVYAIFIFIWEMVSRKIKNSHKEEIQNN